MNEFQRKAIQDIEDAETLHLEMVREKEKYEKLASLALSQVVESIRSYSTGYYEPFLTLAKMSRNYLDKIRNGQSRKQKDDDKYFLKHLQNELAKLIGVEKANIIEIYAGGFEGCYYEIEFTLNKSKRKFLLNIPDTSMIHIGNLDFASRGKVSVGEITHNGNCHEYFFSTYDMDEMKEAFQKRANGEGGADGGTLGREGRGQSAH